MSSGGVGAGKRDDEGVDLIYHNVKRPLAG